MPGRSILDNVIVAFESLHALKNRRHSQFGGVAFKIDISKAYDRVNRQFLRDVMVAMGFDNRWIEMIMLCVTTVYYKVLVNGEEVNPILPGRGLRQGDPLSPYLFILCTEGLSSLF